MIETAKELLDALQWLIDSEEITLGDGGSILGDGPRQFAIITMKKAKRKIRKAEKLALDKQPEV